MLYSGLVSVTFRQFKPQEVVKLVVKAGLQGIEWGGDIHVPHGEVKTAKEVYKLTVGAGLQIAAYGSYYKVGYERGSFDNFKKLLETANELNTPTIRVWAGDKASANADEQYRNNIVFCTKHIADLAEAANIKLSFEYHGGTLTDTNESAIKFFDSVNHRNVRSYWQPNCTISLKENLKGLKTILHVLSNVHMFHWAVDGDQKISRHDLSDGYAVWKEYLNCFRKLQDEHYVMLEFVKKDDPEQFLKDAKVLKNLLEFSDIVI